MEMDVREISIKISVIDTIMCLITGISGLYISDIICNKIVAFLFILHLKIKKFLKSLLC